MDQYSKLKLQLINEVDKLYQDPELCKLFDEPVTNESFDDDVNLLDWANGCKTFANNHRDILRYIQK